MVSEDIVADIDVILNEGVPYAIEVRDETILVDVEDVGAQGPPGPVGPAGPTGPTGPTGPSIANSGMPPTATDGAAGALWVGTGDPTLYGPKVAAENAQLATAPTVLNANRNFELGTVVSIFNNGYVTALSFYRNASATTVSRTLKLWTITGTQIASVVTTAESGSGWKRYALATPVAVTSGDYVVSYDCRTDFDVEIAAGSAFPLGSGNVVARLSVAGTVGAYPSGNSNVYYYADLEFVASPSLTVSLRSEYGELPATYSNTATGEYGVQFKARVNCNLTAIKWYRPVGATLTSRTLRLWTAGGTLLTSVNTTNESGVGWQKAVLGTPYALTVNGQYVVSMGTTDTTGAQISSTIRRLAPEPNAALQYMFGRSGPNGTAGTFPTAIITTDYWLDVEVSYQDPWPVVTGAKPSKVDVFKGRVAAGASVYDNFTWYKPAGARLVMVVCQGPGAGGGSGRRGATNTVRGGGSGGSGGMRRVFWFAAEDLPEQVPVAVGTATTGAPAITTDDTNGAAPNPAQGAEFKLNNQSGNLAFAYGGSNGYGGTVTGASASGGPLGTGTSLATSATGGAGSATRDSLSDSTLGGGGGGGVSAANVFGVGGGAFRAQFTSSEYGVTAGGATDGAAGSEAAIDEFPYYGFPWPFGAPGGGGAGSVAGPGGKGGNGKRGGGGGGGGGSTNGQPSGAGGDGGAGYVMVITYF